MLDGPLKYQDHVAFDRDAHAFAEILNCYRCGVMPSEPAHIAPEVWVEELEWFVMQKARIPSLDA